MSHPLLLCSQWHYEASAKVARDGIGLSVPTGWSLSQEITQKMNRIIINQYQPPTCEKRPTWNFASLYNRYITCPHLCCYPSGGQTRKSEIPYVQWHVICEWVCLKIGHPKNQKSCGWLLIVFQFKSALGDFTPFSYRPNIILILFII